MDMTEKTLYVLREFIIKFPFIYPKRDVIRTYLEEHNSDDVDYQHLLNYVIATKGLEDIEL